MGGLTQCTQFERLCGQCEAGKCELPKTGVHGISVHHDPAEFILKQHSIDSTTLEPDQVINENEESCYMDQNKSNEVFPKNIQKNAVELSELNERGVDS